MHPLGHKQQIDQILNAAKTGRLANAYLFYGIEGIGKKLSARYIAMSLLCSAKDMNGLACGKCPSCLKVEHGTHPDLITVAVEEDKKDISVEQMRQMQAAIQMHPMEGKYKIVIIDDAERMNASAANSALKSLEEPPAATHFFLISSRIHMLLPTINSRCQKISFSPPPLGEAVEFVEKTAGVTNDIAKTLLGISCGSLGLALKFDSELLKDVTTFAKKMWDAPNSLDIIMASEKWAKLETGTAEVLATLLNIYHAIAICQAIQKVPEIEGLERYIEKRAAAESASSIQKKVAAVASAQRDLETTYNKQLMFEQLLFTLAS